MPKEHMGLRFIDWIVVEATHSMDWDRMLDNMRPDLQKPDTIAQALSYSTSEWLQCVKNLRTSGKNCKICKCISFSEDRVQWLKLGYHLICLFKRSSKIFVSLQWIKDMWIMAICLRDVETIVHDWFFFTDFVPIHGEGGWYWEKTYPVIDTLEYVWMSIWA